MNVSFLKCASDVREKNKSYVVIKTLGCEVKTPCSMYKPRLLIKKDLLGDISTINYCYISDFGRYYFVTETTLENGGIIEIMLECDVLMSFREEINGITTLVTRQEMQKDVEIIDNEMLVQNKRTVQHKIFSNTPFDLGAISENNNCICVTVSGGGN